MQKQTITFWFFVMTMILVPLVLSGCGAEDVQGTDRQEVEKSGAFVVGPGYTYEHLPAGLLGTGTASGS